MKSLCCCLTLTVFSILVATSGAQEKSTSVSQQFAALKFRNIGPFRGGRSVAVSGVRGDRLTYFFGSTGGGLWQTKDAGITWRNISDGFFQSGSVGAVAVAPSDSNVIYVGMGEHPVRGVMTSHGDGVYKSTDGGQTWKHIGLDHSRHIAAIRIHPTNPELVYVAVQGAVFAPSQQRGVFRSTDGGDSWDKVLFVNETTGAVDLSLDATNPRILYAGLWDHLRRPWKIRSGGPGSGIHKSTDGGNTWTKLSAGLPETMGKVAVDVSPANPNIVYANIEAEKGGVYRSVNGGKSWTQVNSDRVTVARAWYYIEIFADPTNENVVYVLNAPLLRSIDGGKTFQPIPNPHTDQHDLWINPEDPTNMILANDGGGCISFNGGKSWSSQTNQPTAQFYRVIADRQFPYRLYAGQQDNSTISIASRTLSGSIGERDWFPTAGGESAFLAFDPDNPKTVFGTSIQGSIDRHDLLTDERKSIMVYPQMNLGTLPKDQRYRFNWNGPLTANSQNPGILYHGANHLFRSADAGHSWQEISGDLTRNEPEKHGDGGEPFTNEAAGGEVYNTISYIASSPQEPMTIWVGSDDGLVHRTADEGKTWENVTPRNLPVSLVNSIELSPHDPATAFLAVTRYKFDDLQPMAYMTTDNGKNWIPISNGIAENDFIRVVRQDPVNPNILYAGTEGGLYVTFDQGNQWHPFQLNLPICPITDLTFQDNDLIVATSGRAFWILDDLAAIQQSAGQLNDTSLHVFQPKPSYKFGSGSTSSPSPFAGQNPANGVIIDYCIPKSWSEKMSLKLEIKNENGKVLRAFSSQPAKNLQTWTGGPGPQRQLPANVGLNRFNWDLRTDPIPGVPNVFVMGGHNGPRVVPGTYTLVFSTDEQDSIPVQVDVTVLADPRIEASEADYATQQRALDDIMSMAKDVHESVNLLRVVKSQLATRVKLLNDMPEHKDLADMGRATMDRIDEWEMKLVQRKQKTFQDVINFRNQMNAELMTLAGAMDTNDPRPTESSMTRLSDLKQQWNAHSQEFQAVINESVAQFNKAYGQKGLPSVIVPDKN